MDFIFHEVNNYKIAEVKKSSIKVESYQDALDIMANANYHGSTRQIIHADDLHEDFFSLRTGLAGEILQKYSNYQNKLGIIGDFSAIQSKSLRDFIYESNTGNQIAFVGSVDEALKKLAVY